MENIGYNSVCLLKNGKPWLPISGEMQYSRTERKEWRSSLYKMKACGVDIVQTYVFWIHHEEEEGEFDFTDNRDLSAFLQEIKEAGMYAFLRVGPWPHGEARNGGFPDWLVEKGWKLRSNDERYLSKVDIFFEKLAAQARDYMYEDGGPIIGIQVENEFGGPCGGVPGEEGQEHMRRLRELLEKHGFSAAVWSATAWGGAITGTMLPVWGAYPEAPWTYSDTELAPNPAYLIKSGRNEVNIACGTGYIPAVRDTVDGYPFFTAELGAGVQITQIRRPIISDKDAGALMLCKMASGVNLFGYYVFHGGVNPVGKRSFMNEYRKECMEAGWYSDVPELSYDFQAPIGEFCRIRPSYKEIKLLGLFLRDFGEDLAPLETRLPDGEPTDAADTEHLRYAFRDDGKHGYLFVNNYQRRHTMKEHADVKLTLSLPGETVVFPPVNVKDGDYFVWPFNLPLGNAVLKTANASPLCKINDSFVFYTDAEPVYAFATEETAKIVTLTRTEALNAYKITKEKDYLFVSDALVLSTDRGIELIGPAVSKFKVFPDLPCAPAGFTKCAEENGFSLYEKPIRQIRHDVAFRDIGGGEYEIDIAYHGQANDAFLCIDYEGNNARLYAADAYIADNFYNGTTWNVALKRFGFPTKLRLKIEPIGETDFVFLEKKPIYADGKARRLQSVTVETEYKEIL